MKGRTGMAVAVVVLSTLALVSCGGLGGGGHSTPPEPGAMWVPDVNSSFQVQLSGTVDTTVSAAVFDIDMDNSSGVVSTLHNKGSHAVCYFGAGVWEWDRSDSWRFPDAVIGNDVSGWWGELKYLDIRQIDVIGPLIEDRLDECERKGFDAVDPDFLDTYLYDTGFDISYADQIKFNRWLADQAHWRGMSVALHNDSDQVYDLLWDFDFAITEECFYEHFCSDVTPFIHDDKAMFDIEYVETGIVAGDFCPDANDEKISAVLKNADLDGWRQPCHW